MAFNPDDKNVWDINLNDDWSVDFGSLYLDAGTWSLLSVSPELVQLEAVSEGHARFRFQGFQGCAPH